MSDTERLERMRDDASAAILDALVDHADAVERAKLWHGHADLFEHVFEREAADRARTRARLYDKLGTEAAGRMLRYASMLDVIERAR